jgi:asparagine synthase (glutamine-hydrolysing)
MCGICGIVRLEGVTDRDHASVRGMVELLRHRGPDGAGIWSDEVAVLGHARLSIIDIACGAQPMVRLDQGLAIVFNGEIYNYRELRRELETHGAVFQTNSDTEVLLLGYRHWGEGVFERLNGMFAVAIRDVARERFVVARDRFGEKPFYLHETADGRILFASEIKALFADDEVPRNLNKDVLAEYLSFRSVGGGRTLFGGIEELPAATVRTYHRGSREERRFWDPDVPVARSHSDVKGTIEKLLFEATERRLVSDVPVGSMLSGGVDSSLVTAMAIRASGAPLDTFCVGFEDPLLDERPFARQMAAHIGARHHEIVAEDHLMRDELESLTWAHDAPLTHPNAVPMHLVLRYAKENCGIKVVLSGEGADELFGGYAWYDALAKRPRLGAGPLDLLARLLPPMRRFAGARRVLRHDYPLEANAVTPWTALESLGLDLSQVRAMRMSRYPASRSTADAMYVFDQRTYLPPLLQRQDRMSMAAGVEARVVFLDHLLAEAANSLPDEQKRLQGVRKGLLRQIAGPWLPAGTLDRKKIGFILPLARWLTRGGALHPLREFLNDQGSISAELLGRRTVSRLADLDVSNDSASADLIWSLLSLEMWGRIFLGPQMKTFTLSGARTAEAIKTTSFSSLVTTDVGG